MSALVMHNVSQDCHLRWCFIYLVNFLGKQPNIDWLKTINLQDNHVWENLKPVFQTHGYSLNVISQSLLLNMNTPIPVILRQKNSKYVILQEINHACVGIKSLNAEVMQVAIHEIDAFFDPIIIQLEYSPLFYDKPQLNKQIISFVIRQCVKFKTLSFVSIFVLFFYELLTLLDPILLNIVVEHLDLFASTKDLLITLSLLAGITLIGLGIAYFRQRLWILIFGEFSVFLTYDLIRKIFNFPIDTHHGLDAKNCFTRLYGIDQIYYRFLQQIFFTAMDAVFITIHFVLMCIFQFWLASIDLCFFIALYALNVYFSKLYFLNSHQLLAKQNQSSQILLDALENAQVIKRHQLQEEYFFRWRQFKKQDWNAFLNNDWMQNLMEFLILFLKKINWFFMMSTSIYLILKNNLSLGSFIAFWALKIQVFSRIELSFKRVLQWQYLKAPMQRISEIFAHKPVTSMQQVNKVEFKNDSRNFEIFNLHVRGIQFNDLSFEYGKKYMIKGPSGCGKSSLFMAMGGGLDYLSGVIYYSGRQVQSDDWKSVFQDCAFVMQNEGLFRASFLENICLFDKNINFGLLYEIFYLLDLDELVNELPQGMDTQLGEMAYQLSQGQTQRIFIARALYRQPKWLILDEATCHLDERSEQVLMERLASLSMSMIVTNHRSGLESLFHEVLSWEECVKEETRA